MNLILKETCNLPITSLVQSTYYQLGLLFGKKGDQWTNMQASRQVFTNSCNKGMTEEVSKSNTHKVIQFDCERFQFMASERINQNDDRSIGTFSVDIRKQWCDCEKFWVFHLPCSHVITTYSSICHDYSMHISYIFKVFNVFKVYKERFLGLPHEDNWPQYDGFTLCHDAFMRRKKKGRSHNTRLEQKWTMLRKKK